MFGPCNGIVFPTSAQVFVVPIAFLSPKASSKFVVDSWTSRCAFVEVVNFSLSGPCLLAGSESNRDHKASMLRVIPHLVVS